MHNFVRQDTELDYGLQPHTVQRHCTDMPCCVVFLVALTGFGYVLTYAFQHGDPYRFLHLPNSDRQFCGKDANEEFPLLYFCNSTHGLNPNHTVCVASCEEVPPPACHATSTSSGYASRPVGGLLCVPSDPKDAMELMSVLDNPTIARMMKVTEVFRNWRAIAIVAGAAVLLGFLFCFFLETCAFTIFWGSLLFVILSIAGLGAYLIYQTQEDRIRDQVQGLPPGEILPEITTGDAQRDLLVGIAACFVAFSCLCIACCGSRVVNSALESFKEAADCITDLPTLLLQPFLDLAIQIAVFIFLAVGFWYLISCANMSLAEDALGQFELEYEHQEYFFVAFYLFMCYWIMEMCSALSSFVIAYAVQLWFHQTRGGLDSSASPWCPTLQGLIAGLTYHLGTFAEGSFIIAAVRGLRDFMFLVTKQAADSGNSVVACCGCCCTCCLDCFNKFLKFMSKNAYMDTAMNSNEFCKAAHHAVLVLLEHAGEVATLNTATVVFQIAGISGIAAGGALLFLCGVVGTLGYSRRAGGSDAGLLPTHTKPHFV
mmetsp:Transcript_108124/g.336135  ORF Transcript_108124/g.336135 Transcript_108124/m.336135 type:complete len:542 (+) Transcript_108124:80-1705(+)